MPADSWQPEREWDLFRVLFFKALENGLHLLGINQIAVRGFRPQQPPQLLADERKAEAEGVTVMKDSARVTCYRAALVSVLLLLEGRLYRL